MLYKTSLTIGHKVGSVETWDTATICAKATSLMPIDGFTAIPCVGMWCGVPENSTRLEMVTDESTAAAIIELVPKLAYELGQEAIMAESGPADVDFIESTIPAKIA